MRKQTVFFCFLFKIFSVFERNFFRLLAKSSKSCENYLLRVHRNNLWLQNFFKKFWIVLDFLQKPLAWFSNFYLRVQSINCGRNSFLIFVSRIFSDFERKFFQTFGKKSSKFVKNTFCVSTGTTCGFKIF